MTRTGFLARVPTPSVQHSVVCSTRMLNFVTPCEFRQIAPGKHVFFSSLSNWTLIAAAKGTGFSPAESA